MSADLRELVLARLDKEATTDENEMGFAGPIIRALRREVERHERGKFGGCNGCGLVSWPCPTITDTAAELGVSA